MKHISILFILFLENCQSQFRTFPWSEEEPRFYASGDRGQRRKYIPMLSRFTPYLTEDSLPEPVYGRLQNPGPEDVLESEHFRNLPYPFGANYHRPESDESESREFSEPFSGPREEVEQDRESESSIPYSRPSESEKNEKPFFGPVLPFHKSGRTGGDPQGGRFNKTKIMKKPYSPGYGSEIRIPEAKSRPDRLFEIKPPEEFPSAPNSKNNGLQNPVIQKFQISQNSDFQKPQNLTFQNPTSENFQNLQNPQSSVLRNSGFQNLRKPVFQKPQNLTFQNPTFENSKNLQNSGFRIPQNPSLSTVAALRKSGYTSLPYETSTTVPHYKVAELPPLYSPLQGPFPRAPQKPMESHKSEASVRSLPSSFRNFFPPGFGPFAENQH